MSASSYQGPEDRRKAAHRVDASRFWAVLIGINEYPSSPDCPPLHGCVNDVENMVKFLVNDLGMSDGHIQCLLSTSSDTLNLCIGPEEHRIAVAVTSPTRKHIIDTLLSLSTRCDIFPGDNIIIYFAGHRTWYDPSDLYRAGNILAEGSIEALCPMDCNIPSGTDTSIPDNLTVLFQSLRHNFGTQGVLRFCFGIWRFLTYSIHTPSGTETRIPDISDREINTILTETSRTKGRNITVILDCCYSAGSTRGPWEVARHATPLPPTSIKDMLEAAHTRLRHLPQYHSVLKGDWAPDMSSHVVLAACRDFEPAKEGLEKGIGSHWNGIFTLALIDALKSNSVKEGSTYDDLICALKMPQNTTQVPMVTGNTDARLWYQSAETSKKVSSWPAMQVRLLSVVGVGVGLIVWLRG